MNYVPRRMQKPITIRSDKAAKLLAQLTRDGRSQVEVIEEALAKLPKPEARKDEIAEFMASIEAIVARVDKSKIPTMKEFDAMEYDENGLPR